ncbi:MAG: DUF4405 domain-containing protein [Verrucomicrobia bacterium]|nr:DUF4405 domain-containing protein [Verrucomicrobiota bacterium]
MKRSTWISLIDVLAFISFLFLIATGLLIKYVLPAGSGGIEAHGTGWRAAAQPVSLVWGLTRHEWGTIHFWISVTFLVAIAIHLFIHWRWIVVRFKGKDRQESRMQAAIGIGALLGLLALAIALVLGPKKQVPRSELEQQRDGLQPTPKSTVP